MAAPLPPAIERMLGKKSALSRPAPLPPRPPDRLNEPRAGASSAYGERTEGDRSCGLGSFETALEREMGVKLDAAEAHDALVHARSSGGSSARGKRAAADLAPGAADFGLGTLDSRGTSALARMLGSSSAVGGALAAYLAGARGEGTSSATNSPALSVTGGDWQGLTSSLGAAFGCDDSALAAVSSLGLTPLSPPLRAMLGEALAGGDSMDSTRGELQQAVLTELASSALEILQQEQEQAEILPSLPPLPSPFLGISGMGTDSATRSTDAPASSCSGVSSSMGSQANAIRASLEELGRLTRPIAFSTDHGAEGIGHDSCGDGAGDAAPAGASYPGSAATAAAARLLAASGNGVSSSALAALGAAGAGLISGQSSALSVAERLLLCGRLAGNKERVHRAAPKTPPRKKCEACGALNPTARQCCCACGTRFIIKQKKLGRGRRGAGGGPPGTHSSMSGPGDDTLLPPLQACVDDMGDGGARAMAGTGAPSISSLLVGGGGFGGGGPGGSGSALVGFTDADLESYDGISGDCLGDWGSDSVATFGIIPRPDSRAGSEDEPATGAVQDDRGDPEDQPLGPRVAIGMVGGDLSSTSRARTLPRAGGAAGWSGAVRKTKKTCPACSTSNDLPALACSFCEAKFCVKQTADLLRAAASSLPETNTSKAGEAGGSGASGGGNAGGSSKGVETKVAELEEQVETDASVVGPKSDISSKAFGQLPLASQIQVMQEKAAHRLLAQTLHKHMEEELAADPSLASDPERQRELRQLAQQQLLYQMALTCHAAAPAATADVHSPFGSLGAGMGLMGMDAAGTALAGVPGGAMGPDARAWEEALGILSNGGLSLSGLGAAAASAAGAFADISRATDGLRLAAVAAAEAERQMLGRQADGNAMAPATAAPSASSPSAAALFLTGGPGRGEGLASASVSSAFATLELQLGEHERQEAAAAAAAAAAGSKRRRDKGDRQGESKSKKKKKKKEKERPPARATLGTGVPGGLADAGLEAQRRDKQGQPGRAAEAESSRTPNASAKRLLKQLADFNPSGSGDSAPNVLLPNEKVAQTNGSTWDGEWLNWGFSGAEAPIGRGGAGDAARGVIREDLDLIGLGVRGAVAPRLDAADRRDGKSAPANASDMADLGDITGVSFRRNVSVSAALTLSQGLGPPPSQATDASRSTLAPASVQAGSQQTFRLPAPPSAHSELGPTDSGVRFRRNVSVAAAEALSAMTEELTASAPAGAKGAESEARGQVILPSTSGPADSGTIALAGVTGGRAKNAPSPAPFDVPGSASTMGTRAEMPKPPEFPSSIPPAKSSPLMQPVPPLIPFSPSALSQLPAPGAPQPTAQPPAMQRRPAMPAMAARPPAPATIGSEKVLGSTGTVSDDDDDEQPLTTRAAQLILSSGVGPARGDLPMAVDARLGVGPDGSAQGPADDVHTTASTGKEASESVPNDDSCASYT